MPHATESATRLPADERKRQLIEVAIDLFSRRGFSGTTTKEIAAAAGVTEGIIFRHFATKEHLYAAILEHRRVTTGGEAWIADIQACMERNDDRGLFRRLASKIIETARNDPKFERVMLYAALEGHELAAMHHKQFAMPIGEMLRDYIARRQGEGGLRKVNPNTIVFAMAGMSLQYATHIHMCDYKDAGFGDEEAIETFTTILMEGVCEPAARPSKTTVSRRAAR